MARGDNVEAIHVEKYKQGDLSGICAENTRARDYKKNIIDESKTSLNYDAATSLPYQRGEKNYGDIIISKLEKYGYVRTRDGLINPKGKAVRKDATFMGSIVVSCPDSISEEDRPKFFKAAYDCFCELVGTDNVIDAPVHTDETKDNNIGFNRLNHMHFNFIPLTEDGCLNWNKSFGGGQANKFMLKNLHTNFTEYMQSRGFDVERGTSIANDEEMQKIIENLKKYGIDLSVNANSKTVKRNMLKALKKIEEEYQSIEHCFEGIDARSDALDEREKLLNEESRDLNQEWAKLNNHETSLIKKNVELEHERIAVEKASTNIEAKRSKLEKDKAELEAKRLELEKNEADIDDRRHEIEKVKNIVEQERLDVEAEKIRVRDERKVYEKEKDDFKKHFYQFKAEVEGMMSGLEPEKQKLLKNLEREHKENSDLKNKLQILKKKLNYYRQKYPDDVIEKDNGHNNDLKIKNNNNLKK